MEPRRTVYLDYAATTPLDPSALERMLPYFTSEFGNAASAHRFGHAASRACEAARAEVAALVKAEPEEIIFTSGATESINLALKGVLAAAPSHRRHVITAATEHKAVLDTVDALERAGARVTVLPVDRSGLIDLDALVAAIARDTCLVSVMAANNETGTLAPIRDVAALTQERGVLLHTDATQLVGKLPFDVDEVGVDLASFSSHKIYGPKGVGALYVRRGRMVAVSPLIHGGGHERGLRSGTLNVPGCVGFGRACDVAASRIDSEGESLRELRDQLEQLLLSQVAGSVRNGHETKRLPNISNIRFSGVDADSLLLAMPDVAISSGSACTSATPAPSHVLRAMNVGYDAAGESIRFSVGRLTTSDDIRYVAMRVSEAVQVMRYARDSTVGVHA